MNSKKLLKVLFFILIVSFSTYAQKDEKGIDKDFPTPVSFPYDYFGDYAGNLRASNNKGVISNTPTEFSIKQSTTKGEFIYTIAFIKGKDKKEINTYKIVTIDEELGFYAILDNNGLQFTAILIDKTLYSTFEINDNIMFTALEFTNNGKVRLKIILSQKIKNKHTKTLKRDEAKSSNVMLVQNAVLSKVYK